MKKGKRILSLLLIVVLTFTALPIQSLATESETETSISNDDLTVEGTNGFGTLLSQEIQESQEESASAAEDYEAGYSIVDLSFDGSVATVEYSSLEEAILVVAVHSEDGLKMLASGNTVVSPKEEVAVVTIEGDMPEYFQASAYLVDTYDMSPLCAAYDTPMYTREMQELLASTIEDYDEKLVYNFDDRIETNFAVFKESTKIIDYKAGVNEVTSADDEKGMYVIEKADESFTSLSEGDILAYTYSETDILIAKIDTISIDGTTVTINSGNLELQEVFSHLKMEERSEPSEVVVDDSGVSEGVTYEGLQTNPQQRMLYGLSRSNDFNGDYSINAGFSIKHEIDDNAKVTGTINLGYSIAVEAYVTLTRYHFEVETESGLNGGFEFSVSTGSDDSDFSKAEAKLELVDITFHPNPFMTIGIEPELVLEFDTTVGFEFSLESAGGFVVDSKSGYKDLTKNPVLDCNAKIEGSVFFGLDLGPTIEIGNGAIAQMKLSAEFGIEIVGKMQGSQYESVTIVGNKEKDSIHTCESCISAELSFKISLALNMELLKQSWLSMDFKIGAKRIPLFDIYYSITNNEFGYGSCPYKMYLVTIQLDGSKYLDMEGIEVLSVPTDEVEFSVFGKTNKSGVVTGYLKTGEYQLEAKLEDRIYAGIAEISGTCKILLKELSDKDASDKNIFVSIIPADYIDDTIAVVDAGKCGENVYWSLGNDGMLTIEGTGPMENYYIDSAAPWYNNRHSIASVVIENGVTTIGDYAFEYCPSLNSLEIPNSVTTIGENAFYSCTSLYSLEIPNSVTTIGVGAFASCDGLNIVEIPNSVTTVANYVFAWCDSLTSVRIADGVTTIGSNAFQSCSSLTSVTIPDSVTAIKPGAFSYCDSLTSVTIGDGVNTIGGSLFYSCTSLTDIVFQGNAPNFESDVFSHVTATVYYPDENATWTSDVMQNYGGTITWKPYPLNKSGEMIINEAAAISVTDAQEKLFEEIEPADVENENSDEASIAPYSIYDGEYSGVIVDSYTLKKASFSGLVPGQQYVLLAMVSMEVENPLVAANLLYIDQAAALEDGTLVFQYVQKTPTDTSYVVACGASNKNLNDAEITFPEMFSDGEIQTVNPTVVYDGKTLVEGQDYTIQGTVGYIEPGTYTCYIRGIRNYAGLVECTYRVTNEVASGYSGDIEWTLSAGGVLTFFGNGEMGEYAVSEETGGYVLVGGQPWLNKDVEVTSVVIEEGVTSVGSGAFVDLTTLRTVTFPQNTLTRIGAAAFYHTGVTNVKIPDSVTSIGDSAFYNCSKLSGVEISNNVTTIGRLAFAECSNLSSIEIPDSLTTISYGTFLSCSSLTSVVIGNGVKTIENCAFYDCNSLASVSFGNHVKTIGKSIFEGCSCLTEISFKGRAPSIRDSAFSSVTATAYYPANNVTWTEDVLRNYGGTITWEAYTYICIDHSYETVVTKPTCTQRGYTTYTCSVCIDSYVDSYVDAIGHDYVEGTCTRCGESDPNYVTDNSSGSCGENLTWTLSNDGVLTISGTGPMTDYFYSGNVPWNSSSSLITAVNIGDGVTAIGASAFESCISLTSVEIPDSVTSIGENAFYGCTSLVSMIIPDSVHTIGTRVFYDCTSLTSVTISNSVDIIEDWAFAYCTSLTSVTIPDGVTLIGYYAFYECTSLASVTIPDGVKTIYDYAFRSCSSLTSVEIPDSVTSIRDETFYGCESLISVRIPDSVALIGEDAFYGCTSLTGIYVDDNNSIYSSDEWGVLFNKKKTQLLLAPGGLSGPYRIPDSVNTICDYAFESCTSLISVVIPTSVTTIGSGAFRFCTNLGKITFMGDAPIIGELAFNSVDASAYYFADNLSWTADVLKKYGGSITWIPYAECVHEYSKIVTAPTCTEKGYTSYNCTHCGDSYLEDAVPALGHTEVFVAEKSATCTEVGLTEGKRCSVCNTVIVVQKVILATGHAYDSGVVTTLPGCGRTGIKTFTCQNDKTHTYTEVIPATSHIEGKAVTENRIDSKCDVIGSYDTAVYCTVCGDEIFRTIEQIPAKGHSAGEEIKENNVASTCTAEGHYDMVVYCTACDEELSRTTVTIDKLPHTEEVNEAKPATCTETGLTEGKYCSECNEILIEQEIVPAKGHMEVIDKAVAATCTDTGLTEGKHCLGCNEVLAVQKIVPALGHSFTNYISDNNATEDFPGTKTAKCDRCDETDTIPETSEEIPENPKDETVIRIAGSTRYETGYKVADRLKETLGVDKFEAVVVATGKNFADALAGSYLAVKKNAPIILTNGNADNVALLHEYIKANVSENGTVYILGGEAAVPESVEEISGYTVKRLAGSSRYDTNMEILLEAEISGDEIIVATGKAFADSLSASAAKLPILLVKPNGTLDIAQKALLKNMNKIYIVGGEGAVSSDYEKELAEYCTVERVFGSSRYDTSVEIAKVFCGSVDKMVVANGKNFPDGLCGGPLAAALGVPLILTKDNGADPAMEYAKENAVVGGYVLGGTGALADDTVVDIFQFSSNER